MSTRPHAFDNENLSLVDQVIWTWREMQIKRYLPKHAPVAADLGCGQHARLLRRLLKRGLITRGVGFDVAPGDSTHFDGVDIVQADLNEPLPVTEPQFDIVFSIAVIEHLTIPETHLAEAYRILKPGGVLLLTTPSPHGKPVLEFLAFRLKAIDAFEVADHKHYFTTTELRSVFEKVGFISENVDVSLFQFGFNTIAIARK